MLRERLGKELLFFDGGMGTLLQERGLESGELPEIWNIEHTEELVEIHQAYVEAGSDIILTNTFGANRIKFHHEEYELEDIITAAVVSAKEGAMLGARDDRKVYTALDVGPTGKLLKPMGELDFEEAYEAFKEVVICGAQAGADLIHIETMSDTYELKAAVLAAKENTDLPVTVTVIFDEKGKLLTGGNVASVVALLEGLRVDALGMNCGLGPKQMLPLLRELRTYTSLPIIIKPNAGLPMQRNGETCYDVEPEEFAQIMSEIVAEGACLIGGCCGTTPDHIRKMIEVCRGMVIISPEEKKETIVSSYGKAVVIGDKPVIIGERINPTGKKLMKQALKEGDMDYLLREAVSQQDAGAHILDVNVGLPDIDEKTVMEEAVLKIQGVTNLPLQIDTVDIATLEAAMRIYNGKPMINSVNGKEASMKQVFPLIQKYGGVVVGLTLDENGIPDTAEGRLEIAKKIINRAAAYGIDKKDIVIDVLAMAISADPNGAKVTLKALELIRRECGVRTVLGVSNISFGLPERPVVNGKFYTMAMQSGLSAGIINPKSEEMRKAYYAYCALMNFDENCEEYIARYGKGETVLAATAQTAMTLKHAVENGLRGEAEEATKKLVKEKAALDIINEELIPALDIVGKGFEEGSVFLPQLLMSADAAKSAFAILKESMSAQESEEKKEKVILATVKGDIHDIGKNIVKVLLENYGFDVIDLGKDVAPEKIVDTAIEMDVELVGLSALMTTTVVSMEETIKRLRSEKPDCKVMVGGAVLNQEYADMIGADFYAKDAMQAVYYSKKILKI